MSDVTRAEVCAVAVRRGVRGDGEIFASPDGHDPDARRAAGTQTFEPDLLLSDGEAIFVAGVRRSVRHRRGRSRAGSRSAAIFDLVGTAGGT